MDASPSPNTLAFSISDNVNNSSPNSSCLNETSQSSSRDTVCTVIEQTHITGDNSFLSPQSEVYTNSPSLSPPATSPPSSPPTLSPTSSPTPLSPLLSPPQPPLSSPLVIITPPKTDDNSVDANPSFTPQGEPENVQVISSEANMTSPFGDSDSVERFDRVEITSGIPSEERKHKHRRHRSHESRHSRKNDNHSNRGVSQESTVTTRSEDCSTITCTTCQAVLRATAKFCDQCGAKVSNEGVDETVTTPNSSPPQLHQPQETVPSIPPQLTSEPSEHKVQKDVEYMGGTTTEPIQCTQTNESSPLPHQSPQPSRSRALRQTMHPLLLDSQTLILSITASALKRTKVDINSETQSSNPESLHASAESPTSPSPPSSARFDQDNIEESTTHSEAPPSTHSNPTSSPPPPKQGLTSKGDRNRNSLHHTVSVPAFNIRMSTDSLSIAQANCPDFSCCLEFSQNADLFDWMNNELTKVGEAPVVRCQELYNGLKLIKLLEALSGTPVAVPYNETPSTYMDCSENLHTLMQCIKERTGTEVGGCTAQELLTGNSKSYALLLTFLRDTFDWDRVFWEALNKIGLNGTLTSLVHNVLATKNDAEVGRELREQIKLHKRKQDEQGIQQGHKHRFSENSALTAATKNRQSPLLTASSDSVHIPVHLAKPLKPNIQILSETAQQGSSISQESSLETISETIVNTHPPPTSNTPPPTSDIAVDSPRETASLSALANSTVNTSVTTGTTVTTTTTTTTTTATTPKIRNAKLARREAVFDLQRLKYSPSQTVSSTVLQGQQATINRRHAHHVSLPVSPSSSLTHNSQSTAPPSLVEVLKTPHLLAGFRNFLQQHQSSENLDFYIDIVNFSQNVTSKEELCEEARRIYSKYVAENAQCEVNISGEIRSGIKNIVLHSMDKISSSLFHSARTEVETMLRVDMFPQWISTNMWNANNKNSTPVKKQATQERVLCAQAQVRCRIVIELFNAEKIYVDALNAVVVWIMSPIKMAKIDGNPIIEEEVFNSIFCNIESLWQKHKKLLDELELCITSWNESTTFGNTFLVLTPWLRDEYSCYYSGYSTSRKVLAECKETIPRFADCLKRLENVDSNQTKCVQIEDYMALPINRLPRYIISLSNMLKYTTKINSDYALLTYALKQTTEVVEFVSQHATEDLENTRKLIEISLSVDGHEGGLVVPGRHLLEEGPLLQVEMEGKSKRTVNRAYCFLFTDILLCCQHNTKPSPTSSRPLLFVSELSLSDVISVHVPAQRQLVIKVASTAASAKPCTQWRLHVLSDKEHLSWETSLSTALGEYQQYQESHNTIAAAGPPPLTSSINTERSPHSISPPIPLSSSSTEEPSRTRSQSSAPSISLSTSPPPHRHKHCASEASNRRW
ncbi:Rho guanine nucleotide exchange factor 39 [Pelomyxa schiedti]|nr:Rho guanine nucleotide exchange factor 39 [Pelomyxa schiedti]